ncbi:DUF2793 domain-containing protein [Methylobacterium frigidaeris]|uniref:DUF2793 domain-containing protein n=1 Tax=Methylobacterium frigidaeris TaxID=2038277 RepID=A0AA37HD66_9HYPH|nr:DUF2793 domain-containing protein [Methylobacterium frigidaeris]GJD63321.1 hypothetical protein MPEAHAMD_3487 [Methylobacterium frigidaeris]
MPDAATANLALPLMAAAQAQKHVTHNEALVALDTLVQLAVLDKDLTAPPASPAEGDRYLIAGAAPTGAWAGWAGRVVRYQDGAWRSFVPRPGWLAFVADEADLYTCTGVAWASFRSTLTALQNLARLGLGTTADAQNPFAAKLNKALWTALTVGEGGSGDLRYTLNKEASGNTLSLLFQSGFSGRAELGLTGDDDLRLKVSPDGAAWREALRVDRGTGGLDLAAAEASAPVAATVDLGALPALKVALTGSGTVTSFGTSPHRLRLLRFTGAATLTHNPASLVLPGGAPLVTAPGDTALATSDASGAWTVRDYVRASGKPVTGPAAADITDASAPGRSVLAGTAAQGATALGLGSGNVPTFASLALSGAAGAFRTTRVLTGSAFRWDYGVDGTAESGSNAGSNFFINTFSDDGTYRATPFVINRNTGSTTVSALTVSGGAVNLDNGASNVIGYRNAGVAPPTTTTRSVGTKIVLFPALSGSDVDYAIGIDGSTLWNSVPTANAFHKWYAGTVPVATLSGSGVLSVAGEMRVGGNTSQYTSSFINGASGYSRGVNIQSAGMLRWAMQATGTPETGGNSGSDYVLAAFSDTGSFLFTPLALSRATGAATFSHNIVAAGSIRPGSYTVATVPAGTAGAVIYVSNGRKSGEGAGAGTGVVACYSNGNWRRLSDDSPVAA